MSPQVTSFILCFFLSISANASVINETGNINGLNLQWEQSESNELQIYNEAQNISINEQEVHVDYLLGTNLFQGDSFRGKKNNDNLFLASGNYNSHLIHFDPIGKSTGIVSNFRITFEEDIVGIIFGKKKLNRSDDIFGGIGTIYEKNRSRGLENHDFLTFESTKTLLVDRLWVGRYWVDDARIITQSVPEPGSMALFGLGIICLLGARSAASKKERTALK